MSEDLETAITWEEKKSNLIKVFLFQCTQTRKDIRVKFKQMITKALYEDNLFIIIIFFFELTWHLTLINSHIDICSQPMKGEK
jgi:hypothetical protein